MYYGMWDIKIHYKSGAIHSHKNVVLEETANEWIFMLPESTFSKPKKAIKFVEKERCQKEETSSTVKEQSDVPLPLEQE
jgi:hypothetical protein